MTENITTTTPAPKAKPRKAAKKPAPKLVITGVQHRVLKAVANKAMSRKSISDKAFNGNSINFVPILTPLIKAKLLKPAELDIDGRAETVFIATAAGKKISAGPAPVRNSNGKSHQPLPRAGGTITKTYLGKDHAVKVTTDGFAYKGKTYPSLTACAKAVRGSNMEVNGWAFFGLTKSAK